MKKLLTSRLYEPVLIRPVVNGADNLKIVSGFATPAMAEKHLRDIQEGGYDVSIELIYGMSRLQGVETATHKGFMDIQENRFKGKFSCDYSISLKPIHAKIYTWLKESSPILSYTGSANYTQNGFIEGIQQESITETNPEESLDFFNMVKKEVVNCIYEPLLLEHNVAFYKGGKTSPDLGLPELELSLLKKDGTIHERSGLNWGQREKRDHNQAYIPIPQTVAQTDFFPEKTDLFTVFTDDEFSFIGRIAQDNRKALHSTESNAILGKYFRKRLGLQDGQRVTVHHLKNYGRTSVKFVKIDNETYYMDFSPKSDDQENEIE